MIDTNDQSPAPRPGPADRSRWVRRALFVSVAINLLIAGLVAGAFLAHGGHDDRFARHDPGPGFGRYIRALSPEDRAALRDAYRAGRASGRQAFDGRGADPQGDRPRDAGRHPRAYRADQAALLTALRAEPFDLDAVQTIFNRQVSRMARNMARGQALLTERISDMSASQRAAFADRIEQMAQHRDHGNRRSRDR